MSSQPFSQGRSGEGRRASRPELRPEDIPSTPVSLRRIARLFVPYRPRLSLLLALIFLSAGLGVISPFLLREFINVAYPQHDTKLVIELVAGMIALSVITSVIGVAQTWISNQVGQRVMHDLRAAVYAHLQRMSLAFFTRTRTGEVQSRIANDIGGVDSVVTSTATSIVQNVTTVVATVVAMFLLDWRLAAFSLFLLPFFVWLTRRVGEERRRIQSVRQSRLADMSTLVEESLSVSGILLGKTMGRSPELVRRFGGESVELADLEVRARMAGRWRMASVQMSFAIMPALVYLFAGVDHGSGGNAISIGTVVAFTTLQTRLLFPIQSLLSVGLEVQTSLALFGRIFEYLDLPVDIVERPDARALSVVRGDARLEDVWFRYAPGSPWTLSGISAEIPAGTTTALVGETGSGKTTLAYLVARLYEPERGSVSIDGIDICDMTLASLAATVGLVSQETYLFHASIRENLRFACPDASDEQIEQAARAAQIHDLISSLPDGYDTPVGERGYRFSGGEKQRMAIARTVLRNPPVLILDEATSALDNETERAVQQALDELARGRTTIAIAHRLSTIRDADQILVLDAGRIVERGSHDELVELGGRYAELLRGADVGLDAERPEDDPSAALA
ncbi:MAG TPA: ABC transporter ATP-binding protein [Solirubrobacteraceae bacterium]|nr:ABC transporter ATP-binding protein [Solirubrobacteraceae bacterium]